MHIDLEWESAKAPRLFPFMRGRLSAWRLSATETQFAFDGRYQPPLGPLGTALGAMVGHRIAEASVHRFVTDIAKYLRHALTDRDAQSRRGSSLRPGEIVANRVRMPLVLDGVARRT